MFGAKGVPQSAQGRMSDFGIVVVENMVKDVRSFASLDDGTYRFDIIPDTDKKGALNVYGIEVNAPPEQQNATFFIAEEPAIEGHLAKAVYWDEREAKRAAEAMNLKCRREKGGMQS